MSEKFGDDRIRNGWAMNDLLWKPLILASKFRRNTKDTEYCESSVYILYCEFIWNCLFWPKTCHKSNFWALSNEGHIIIVCELYWKMSILALNLSLKSIFIFIQWSSHYYSLWSLLENVNFGPEHAWNRIFGHCPMKFTSLYIVKFIGNCPDFLYWRFWHIY